MSFKEAGKLADFPPGTMKKMTVGGLNIAVGMTEQGPFAMADACAHEGGSLSEGQLEDGIVTCPLHAWQFEAKTAKCLTESTACQHKYNVKVEAGVIMVELPQKKKAEVVVKIDPATHKSSVEKWKTEKHGLDCWGDILKFARENTPMDDLTVAELERMKWWGFYYRKTNDHDHYMLRVRIPGCEMTSEQMRTLAFIAYESGYSILDVTTRGNIQIQGLTIDKVPGVRAALEKAGLTAQQSGHDNVRNITSHPLSGIDPEELMDTRQLAVDLQDMIVGNREFSDLPRKFNLALTGRDEAQVHTWTQDIGLVATRMGDGTIGFHLLLGGTQGQTPTLSWPAPVLVRSDQVVSLVNATLSVFREQGYRHDRLHVRFHFLMERLGNERVIELIEEKMGVKLERTEDLPRVPQERENYAGWFTQKQTSLEAACIPIPVGRISWDQAQGISEISRKFGSGSIRTSCDQNIVIPDIASADKEAVEMALAEIGLSVESDSVTRNILSCTGKQFCNLSITETKGYGQQLIEQFRRLKVQLKDITIHFSGCPNSCGMTLTADIGLQGTKTRLNGRPVEAFDVFLGGGLGGEVHLAKLWQKAVPFEEIAVYLKDKIQQYYKEREGEQTFSQFWRKKLENHVVEKLSEHPPRWICGQCDYVAIGEVPPTSCPVCSAIRSKFDPAPEGVEISKTGSIKGAIAGRQVSDSGQPVHKPKKIVIVGGSIGSHTAAQAIREQDSRAEITIITDEKFSFYNRLNLTKFLNDDLTREALHDYAPDWYVKQRIEVMTDSRAINVNAMNHELLLDNGTNLSYDSLILSHGSSAALPPFYRDNLQGVVKLRTVADVEEMVDRVSKGCRVVVIGGGVLGLEVALGLNKRGAKVTVLEYQDRLMPRNLDEEAAGMLRKDLEAKGITVACGSGVDELIGSDFVTAVKMADGKTYQVEMVVCSTGIKPNIDWVKRSGIDCGRGVIVDDGMRTNAPDVFAVGDVAQWKGIVFGLWNPTIEQARVAATNVLGGFAAFKGHVPATILKCIDLDVVSIGDIDANGPEADSDIRREGNTYKRVFFRKGLPVGAVLVGTTRGMGELKKMIEVGQALEQMRNKILPATETVRI